MYDTIGVVVGTIGAPIANFSNKGDDVGSAGLTKVGDLGQTQVHNDDHICNVYYGNGTSLPLKPRLPGREAWGTFLNVRLGN